MIKTETEEEILCVELLGYVGDEQAAPILLTGLSKLEYRGYDSAGIAVRNEAADKIAIVKAKRASENSDREDRRRFSRTGYLRYRSYPLGDSWRAF